MITKYLTIQRNPINVYPNMHEQLIRDIPADVLEMIGQNDGYIAGGVISSALCERAFDEYDIFARSLDDANCIIHMLYEDSRFEEKCVTDKAITFIYRKDYGLGHTGSKCLVRTIKLQVIYMPDRIGEPHDVIRSFDFVACMGAFDPASNEFIFAEGFLGNNIDHILVYNHDAIYPLNSLLRIPKYIKKGYSIDTYNMLLIAMRVNRLCIENLQDVAKEAAAKYQGDEETNKLLSDDIEAIVRGDFDI